MCEDINNLVMYQPGYRDWLIRMLAFIPRPSCSLIVFDKTIFGTLLYQAECS
jgi:hypothetical protein